MRRLPSAVFALGFLAMAPVLQQWRLFSEHFPVID